jgi:hypothetical protein
MSAPDLVLLNIIKEYMELDSNRIVFYNQNFDKPTDEELFIVISQDPAQIISTNQKFDSDTNEEIMSMNMYQQYQIEITSVNRTALERKHEILMAIKSYFGVLQQEINNIKIMRNGNILDLSGVDGARSLHRFQIPVIISYLEIKKTVIIPIDKFQPLEVINEQN